MLLEDYTYDHSTGLVACFVCLLDGTNVSTCLLSILSSLPLFLPLPHLISSASKDLAYCQRLASNIKSTQELPPVCQTFPSVVDSVKRKQQPVSDEDIAFQGMRPGQALQARRSRAAGVEHQAKLTRRLTSSGRDYHYMPQKTK